MSNAFKTRLQKCKSQRRFNGYRLVYSACLEQRGTLLLTTGLEKNSLNEWEREWIRKRCLNGIFISECCVSSFCNELGTDNCLAYYNVKKKLFFVY